MGEMRGVRGVARWLGFALALIVAIAASAGAFRLADAAWNGVVDYESPYVDVGLPAAQASPALVDRVVLVVIDGLREDASRKMSSLEALRGYGADYVLTAPQPTLSYPNWTTIFSGTQQDVHGVVTNWFEGAAPVETLFTVAAASETTHVVVGPSDLATLYPEATRADGSFLLPWSKEYLSDRYVDETLRLVEAHDPTLVILHMPEVDDAGHDHGGASEEYVRTVARVDTDLRRLIERLQDARTTFVVVADHGHIDTGGHGGWEPEVVRVPCVIAGDGVKSLSGVGTLTDIAPTVAVLAGMPVPRQATGRVLDEILSAVNPAVTIPARGQRERAITGFAQVLLAPIGESGEPAWEGDATADDLSAHLESARATRLDADRLERRGGPALWIALAALGAMLGTAVVSWRAALSALAGAAAYSAVYNALFFLLHGNQWSLSAFNSEDLITSWMNTRMIEAALAGLAAAAVAAAVYPLLRHAPKAPRGRYLAGWLTLGPLAVLYSQAVLALQVAWFIWAWGVTPVWGMPDLKWGFKFDLDLIQMTALGAAALLAPVISYLVGRYHPRTRVRFADGGDSAKEDTAFAPPPSSANPSVNSNG